MLPVYFVRDVPGPYLAIYPPPPLPFLDLFILQDLWAIPLGSVHSKGVRVDLRYLEGEDSQNSSQAESACDRAEMAVPHSTGKPGSLLGLLIYLERGDVAWARNLTREWYRSR